MFGGFSTGKCKTNCKLCVGRVKLMRNKKHLQLKQLRREVADLLRINKQENARIRVEAVIQEQKMLRAYDIIELFVELLAVRVELIAKSKDIPPDMLEAVSSVIYAAQRIQDFPELGVIRGLLGHKFGREYIAEASDDTVCRKWQVNENLRSCLAIDSPAPELKLQTLSEIAQEENVEWDVHAASMDMLPHQRPPPLPPGYFGGPPPSGPGGPPGYGGPGGPGGPSGGFPAGPSENAYQAAAGMPPPTSLPGARGEGRGPKPPPGGGGGQLPQQQQPQGQAGPNPPWAAPPPNGATSDGSEWADAASAAAAARAYSERARAAADSAERYASPQPRQAEPGPSPTGPTQPAPPKAASQPPTQPPRPKGVPTLPPGLPPTPPPAQPPPAAPAPGTQDSQSSLGGIGGFRERSAEDIQRDYDAVPGYSKTEQGGGAPSAPPAPPPGFGGTSAPGAPKEDRPPNDFDELTKRLEALRRNS